MVQKDGTKTTKTDTRFSVIKEMPEGFIVEVLRTKGEDKKQEIAIHLNDFKGKSVSGRILSSKNVADYNDFDHPSRVQPVAFKDAKLKKDELTVKLPAKSIVVLEVK